MIAVAGRSRAESALAEQEAEAWREYLDATRGQESLRYEEVEPWAWTRLQAVLRAVRTRRRVVIEDDGA